MEKKATFGAGCFWGVEAAFRQVEGVTKTEVGFEGGRLEHPTYRQVCSHTTGHAEVVEVTYDPELVSYKQLLDLFWSKHNPRRSIDPDDQYRSVIFVHDEEQRAAAERSKAQVGGAAFVEPAQTFYRAEEHHQQYYEKHGRSSCTPALAATA
jgi:peptide-methionine (S)-S-oxide reductase